MAQGKCPGCGATGSACKIRTHTVDCPDWLALFLSDPDGVPEPEAAYVQWVSQGRADDRAARRETAIAGNENARAALAGRFARSRDLTEEDLRI